MKEWIMSRYHVEIDRIKIACSETSGFCISKDLLIITWQSVCVVHFCGNGASASKSGGKPRNGSNGGTKGRGASESGGTPGVGSKGVIRVCRRSKAGICLETGLTV
ncbi:hypothetical protein Y032_0297g1738 [Ancylostoma ceylanicum]|nr:hypothetical protein Y032_0297g1738 [Ancylostoma ceylanicum]